MWNALKEIFFNFARQLYFILGPSILNRLDVFYFIKSQGYFLFNNWVFQKNLGFLSQLD